MRERVALARDAGRQPLSSGARAKAATSSSSSSRSPTAACWRSCRDITELKEREEALAARQGGRRGGARRRRAHPRGDADRARQHERRRHAVRQGLPLEFSTTASTCGASELHARHAASGASGFDMMRYLVERGDFGPTDDVETTVTEGRARDPAARRRRYERRTPNGRYVEFNFRPLTDGGLLGIYRDITELKSARKRSPPPRRRPKARASGREERPRPRPPTRRSRPSSPP